MTGIADTFQQASFNGISFPYVERTIKCSLRHHTHEYPHAPGGDDEPLGRKLYEFGFTCDFDTGFDGQFPGIYPGTLILLFATFGEETTADLVVPGFATFKARAIDWDARLVSRIRSGEKVSFKFIEVLDEIVAVQNFTTAPQALPTMTANLVRQVTTLAAAPQGILPANAIPKVSDLGTITKLTASLSLLPTNSPEITTQSSALLAACQDYGTLPFLNYPRANEATDALHVLYQASLQILKDALLRGRPILIYVTSGVLSISQVATRIYGSTERTVELMRLNALPDALSIPSGSEIRHYAPT
jgi:prophage DNA circulation protein